MKITYQLTPRDFREAVGPTKARKIMMMLVLLSLLALIPLYFLASDDQRDELFRNVLPFLGVISFWLALMWLLPYWTVQRQLAGMPAAKSTMTYEFTENGVSCRTENGESANTWAIYSKWREKGAVFLLHTSPAVFHLIPKRAFAPGDEEQFRALLSSKVKKG